LSVSIYVVADDEHHVGDHDEREMNEWAFRHRSFVVGHRAIVSTEGPLRVRSRRRWDLGGHVGFLA
jgi:hypothetical protein